MKIVNCVGKYFEDRVGNFYWGMGVEKDSTGEDILTVMEYHISKYKNNVQISKVHISAFYFDVNDCKKITKTEFIKRFGELQKIINGKGG